ncbi:MAG: hypothetical protein E6G30_02255 [Actinobacteria bacterium]|nr:MAG: hypothetical protein E6G30_02255 [Actinomycetota bacterium]
MQDEFPELALIGVVVDASPGRSPRGVRQRLKGLSDRFRGSHAVTMRQAPIPWAYRVFYRHVGLDPDADRTPGEAAAVRRLLHGAFRSENVVDDALLIALVETGVPIWALDAGRVSDVAPGHGVTRDTRRMALLTVQVAGVPSIHVEEALHTCVDVLRSG